MINGSQCTIVFYVDNNKISHVDEDVVTNVINDISKHFGELTVSRGKKHDFLGMDIEIKDRKVFISMKNQIAEAIEWGATQSGRKPVTPVTNDLFLKTDQAEDLSIERSDNFHSIVQKLLYICKRGRPDIEPALSYLCTRVSNPTVEDEKKLFRVLDYLTNTLDDVRIIGASSLDNLYMWIDASYTTHPNMRSHMGGAMSFGTGIIHGKSSKQKLNTKSSTEAELVVVSDYIPYHVWIINFLRHQGYEIKNKILYQDNESAIKMEVNGRNSCTGNSRHIDIRYFFIHDRIKSGNLDVVYCPTEKMLADFFTKPLQGKIFKNFRSAIMGHEEQKVI